MPIAAGDPRLARVGFAKLEGDGIQYYLQKYEVILGRSCKDGSTDVVVGDKKALSRQHAKICYNFSSQCWELTVLGKNGLALDGVHMTPDTPPAVLKSRAKLLLSDKVLYFLLPLTPAVIQSRLQHSPAAGAAGGAKRPAPSPLDPLAKHPRLGAGQVGPSHTAFTPAAPIPPLPTHPSYAVNGIPAHSPGIPTIHGLLVGGTPAAAAGSPAPPPPRGHTSADPPAMPPQPPQPPRPSQPPLPPAPSFVTPAPQPPPPATAIHAAAYTGRQGGGVAGQGPGQGGYALAVPQAGNASLGSEGSEKGTPEPPRPVPGSGATTLLPGLGGLDQEGTPPQGTPDMTRPPSTASPLLPSGLGLGLGSSPLGNLLGGSMHDFGMGGLGSGGLGSGGLGSGGLGEEGYEGAGRRGLADLSSPSALRDLGDL
ncbi:hypothetical protein QJQ45_002540 [Haematococcus lacustris]|nr:hypothetical protein QJQ45_002540 [Haematococcus lacustris]